MKYILSRSTFSTIKKIAITKNTKSNMNSRLSMETRTSYTKAPLNKAV